MLCKESFHHFPRPYIALHEMLRVARVGVVLIEPQISPPRLLDMLRRLVKHITRGDTSYTFEQMGNYIFRVNVHEILRIQTAMQHPMVAVRYFNDFFQPRLSQAGFEPKTARARVAQLGVLVQDVLCALRLMNHGLASVICFTAPPDEATCTQLRRSGFHIISTPKNPYL